MPRRLGLEHPWRVPSKTFKTKDGYITASATSGALYPRLCKALELEELVDDPLFKTNAIRVENRDVLYPVIEKKMMTKTAKEWEEIFEAAGIPTGIMYNMDQVFSDAHVHHRGMLRTVNHPALGALKMIGVPWKYKNSEEKQMTPPPLLGEHTDEILRDVIGYSREKIDALRRDGAAI